MAKEDKERELKEKVKGLEEKIKKLEGKKASEEKKATEVSPANSGEEVSIAGGLLQNVGKMFGLGGLLKGIEKSPAFKERLEKIDEEIERKLSAGGGSKESPSPLYPDGHKRAQVKRAEEERPSHIPMGIPPGARGRTVRRRPSSAYGGKQKPEAKPSPPPPPPKEQPADIFDEKDYIKVIAEIPGVEERDIKIDLVKENLAISADAPDRKYHQKLKLPCEPKGKLEKSYKNGILEVKIKK